VIVLEKVRRTISSCGMFPADPAGGDPAEIQPPSKREALSTQRLGESAVPHRKILVGIVIVGAMSVGVGAMTSTAWAAATPNDACSIYARQAAFANNTIWGVGGRQDCSDAVTIAVAVYKDVSFLPDPREGSTSQSGFTNGSLAVKVTCDGNDPYYVTVNTSTGSSLEGAHGGNVC
jgi:hypothetical protein